MKWLDKVKGLFNRGPKVERFTVPMRRRSRFDEGPAEVWYVKRKLPRSCFTKAMTPHRIQAMREALARLRPEQREIAYRNRWNKGVVV